MNGLKLFVAITALACTSAAHATVTLVQTGDLGFYNDNISTVLNTGNDPTNAGPPEYFPDSEDGTYDFLTPPDLTAANSALGNWLIDPQNLNGNWSNVPIAIPNNWTVGTEVAIIYQFDTLSATNVSASFGVDNGIFVWLDGAYIFGARAAGTHSLGEYVVSLGDLSEGTHYLQLLLEDHGDTNGYDVLITADTFVPLPSGPPAGNPVPEPASLALLGIGLASLSFTRRRKIAC